MLRSARNLAISLSLLTGVGIAAWSAGGSLETNYSLLPRDAVQVEADLRALKLTLRDAVNAAELSTAGKVEFARTVRTPSGQWVYELEAHAGGATHAMRYDAASGQLLADEIVPTFPLHGDPVTGPLITTASGLMYYELREGTGAQPAGPSAKVRVHYSGWLVDGKKFDSSVDRGQPIDFALNQVISGWTEGVGSMKVGGKRKLIVPYQLAYGAGGRGAIPPKATLIFDVELLDLPK